MNKVFTKIFKATKILVMLLLVLSVQKVNVVSSLDRLSNTNLNKTIDLTAMAVKVKEFHMNDKYYPLDTFTGDLTGYGADCPLCSGYLACTNQDVRNGTTKYFDEDYGNVYIVASSKKLPCGSIVTFDAPFLQEGKSYAIVLDRGVLGTDLDLLVSSEKYAYDHIERHKISYDVLRFGWSR